MPQSTALERTHLEIRGVRSQLVLEDGRITITKESPTQPGPTTITVDVDRVRGTSLNVPARGGRGWIHLSAAGGSPPPPGELAAAADPYTLPITARAATAARRFGRLVDKHVAERGMPRDAGAVGGRYSSGVSLVDPPGTGGAGSGTPADAGDEGVGALAEHSADMPPPDAGASPRPDARDQTDDEDDRGGLVTQLQQLADLHTAGALTDEEFERAKARLLR